MQVDQHSLQIIRVHQIQRYDHEELVKEFKLGSKLSSANTYLFNAEGRIGLFSNVYSIIEYYYIKRLKLYGKRKEALIDQLQYEMLILTNKSKFIWAVKQGEIDRRSMTEESLLKELKKEFDIDPQATSTGFGTYEYLIGTNYRSFTNEKAERMQRLVDEKEGK